MPRFRGAENRDARPAGNPAPGLPDFAGNPAPGPPDFAGNTALMPPRFLSQSRTILCPALEPGFFSFGGTCDGDGSF
jgi:hypothetical protein